MRSFVNTQSISGNPDFKINLREKIVNFYKILRFLKHFGPPLIIWGLFNIEQGRMSVRPG